MGIDVNDIDPFNDGLDHINIYSRSRSELGRLLSNFARTAFTHPEYGYFASMEAYWYWCKSGKMHDRIRRTVGSYAKSMGRNLPFVFNPKFNEDIDSGLTAKLQCNPTIQAMLRESTLPFMHYYVVGERVVLPNSDVFDLADWYTNQREIMRVDLL